MPAVARHQVVVVDAELVAMVPPGHFEVAVRNQQARKPLDRPRTGQDRVEEGLVDGCAFQRFAIATPVFKIVERDRAPPVPGEHGPDHRQPVCIAVRKRAQQHSIDDAEHRSGHSDCQRERCDGAHG